MNPITMVRTAIGAVIVVAILLVPVHEVEQAETYYISEPLTYEETFLRASQVNRFCFPWLCAKTEVQYGIKNTDSDVGQFVITFIFDTGKDRATENVPQTIASGEEMTVSQTSPFRGVSEFSVDVSPPSKLVPHQRTVTKSVNTLSQLRGLRRVLR